MPLPPTLMPKLLLPDPLPPNKYKWYVKEDGYLMEDDEVTLLSLSAPPFSHCSSLPILSVPYPHISCNYCRPLARLSLSVLFCHFHPCLTPRVFSVSPLSILFSVLPAAIISLSPQHIFLPSIRATSAIFYPYTHTHPPPPTSQFTNEE